MEGNLPFGVQKLDSLHLIDLRPHLILAQGGAPSRGLYLCGRDCLGEGEAPSGHLAGPPSCHSPPTPKGVRPTRMVQGKKHRALTHDWHAGEHGHANGWAGAQKAEVRG